MSEVETLTFGGSRTEVAHRFVTVDDVRLHYVEAGRGPLVVLLHGFPDFWYSWRYQIPALVAAGYRVIAPDLRGYNLSDKPLGIASYRAGAVARDISALIQASGDRRAVVVAHDWGAGIAWLFAMRYPRMLERLVILNGPHPVRFARALKTFSQLRRSWYIFFFQLPWLPEAFMRADNFAAIRRVFQTDPVSPDAFAAEDVERYVEAIARPGALTAAINYYRALVRGRMRMRDLRVIDAPVLVIWGDRDRYLGRDLAEPDREWVSSVRVERLREASHWVHVDQPERVNRLLLEFLEDIPGAL